MTPVTRLAVLALSAAACLVMPSTSRAAAAFPAQHEGYHTYAEMADELDHIVADHPGIATKFSLGQSYEGRPIWALKISDDVGRDEAEPEVLFMSLAHAREWLSAEQNLHLAHLLTDNYRANPANVGNELERRVTNLVNSLEIYIVPMVNPDGAEYDIVNPATGFKNWRKNRQPVGDGVQPGIDLNRNYGFMWGCCGGSTGKPGSLYYRGRQPWQSVEDTLVRNFVLGRVVGGQQQIRAAIDWHAFNEQIAWPFGYTKADQPRPMAADDLAAFRAVSREMARRNGYTALQLSDLYVMDGTSIDWLYGEQRIFALTVEVYPTDGSHVGGFHPPDDVIERETTRNDGAVLYFLEQVACPYAAAGLGDTHCGPLDDDFETARGWQVDPDGTDTAASGAWERAIPRRNATSAGVKQRAYGYSARYALVTGAARGASAAAADLDGRTSVRSAPIQLSGPGGGHWLVQFRYSFAHGATASAADYVRLAVGGDEVWRVTGSPSERNAKWRLVTLNLDAYAGQTVRLLIDACDCATDSLVEAAIDDVRVYQVP